MSIPNGIVSSRMNDRDVPCSLEYDAYILERIRFVRVCSNSSDFNNRSKFLTAKSKHVQEMANHRLHTNPQNREKRHRAQTAAMQYEQINQLCY